jgi:SET domain-containing protein
MPLSTQIPCLYIINNEQRGRSVLTSEHIPKDSIIEICPVIILSEEDTKNIHKTHLHDYYFVWDIEKGSSAIALGYGSLYNHSETPNAEIELDYSETCIRFIATRDIDNGEEITIDYIAAKDENIKLWFDPQ